MQISLLVNKIHSLRDESYQDLQKIAKKKFIELDASASKIELISAIVANEVIEEELRAHLTPEILTANKRENYKLIDGCDNEYYLKLTRAQIQFIVWCMKNNVDFSGECIDLIAMPDDPQWETP